MRITFIIITIFSLAILNCNPNSEQNEKIPKEASELFNSETLQDAKVYSEEISQENNKQFYSCKPCKNDSDCGNGACVSYMKHSTSRYCGDYCQTKDDCPRGIKPYFIYNCINNYCMSPEECKK